MKKVKRDWKGYVITTKEKKKNVNLIDLEVYDVVIHCTMKVVTGLNKFIDRL